MKRPAQLLVALVFLTSCATTPASSPDTTPAAPAPFPAPATAAHPLDSAFIVYAVGEVGEARRDEFRGGVRTSTSGTEREEQDVVVQDLGDTQLLISWFGAQGAHAVQVVDLGRKLVWTAVPDDDERMQINRATLRSLGTLDDGDFVLPEAKAQEKKVLDPAWADSTYLRGRWLEYSYDNGKFFRNSFHGDLRHSNVKRGLLKELVTVQPIGAGKLFISWKDDRLGHVAQVLDLSRDTVWAAVPLGSGPQIWRGKLEGSGPLPEDAPGPQTAAPPTHAPPTKTETKGTTP